MERKQNGNILKINKYVIFKLDFYLGLFKIIILKNFKGY